MGMIPFHTLCPDRAKKEVRSVLVQPGPTGALNDEYGFVEFYCDDPQCDCRRVFIQVVARSRPGTIMASINFGWEDEEYYRQKMPYMPEAAREITDASLDPINEQSPEAPELLSLFQEVVLADPAYKARLKRHYELFRRSLRKRR